MKHLILALLIMVALPAFASDAPHENHEALKVTTTDKSTASTAAFKASNAKMHKGMDIDYSGNADIDFVRGMIAHHEGAVEMAQIELKHGKNDDIRDLARDIIKAQKSEISFMKRWLKNAERAQAKAIRDQD